MPSTILYTFRRCPYAMRARLALTLSQEKIQIREIVLRNKPATMLHYSPKGTVPVLILHHSESEAPQVIDESLDIMKWAFKRYDPDNFLDASKLNEMLDLISINDGEFKDKLDRYKYADRHPEQSEQEYRKQGEGFLELLDKRLQNQTFLFGEQACLADLAIFPFIRQFAHVDLEWFDASPYDYLKRWLSDYKESDIFLSIMKKYPAWKEGDEITWLPLP
ncbi:glutathione S-transferase, partial [Oleiphilus sp. HI0123]